MIHPRRERQFIKATIATGLVAGVIFALAPEVAAGPPADGLRYWSQPLEPIPAHGSYVSVVVRDGQYELWRGSLIFGETNTHGRLGRSFHDAAPEEKVCIVSRGPSLQTLGVGEPHFDASLIDDLFTPGKPEVLSPRRGFTRTYMTWLPDIGYVFYCCTTRGYSPGAIPLFPAILTSPTGEKGSWTYRGTFRGEPAEEAKKRVIWSDGGSIHRLDDGRWRAYMNGFGQAACAVESDSLDGPWSFVRNAAGDIRELLPDLPQDGKHGGVWLNVLQVGPGEWHLWLTDTWPAQAIWHFSSTNGLDWTRYGEQPEITRAAVDDRAIKCFRTYLDPGGKEIVGMLSVRGRIGDGPEGWVLHVARLPVGLQP